MFQSGAAPLHNGEAQKLGPNPEGVDSMYPRTMANSCATSPTATPACSLHCSPRHRRPPLDAVNSLSQSQEPAEATVPMKAAERLASSSLPEVALAALKPAARAQGSQEDSKEYLTALAQKDQMILDLEKQLAAARAEASESTAISRRVAQASKKESQRIEATLDSSAASAEQAKKQTMQAWQALEVQSRTMDVMQNQLMHANSEVDTLRSQLNLKEKDNLQRLQASQRNTPRGREMEYLRSQDAPQAAASATNCQGETGRDRPLLRNGALQAALQRLTGQDRKMQTEPGNKASHIEGIETERAKALQVALQKSSHRVQNLQMLLNDARNKPPADSVESKFCETVASSLETARAQWEALQQVSKYDHGTPSVTSTNEPADSEITDIGQLSLSSGPSSKQGRETPRHGREPSLAAAYASNFVANVAAKKKDMTKVELDMVLQDIMKLSDLS